MFAGEFAQALQPHHRSVVVHDLADHAGRIEARPGARNRPPPRFGRLGPARRLRGRAAETCGRGAGNRPGFASGSSRALMVAARSCAEMPVVDAAARFNRDGERGPMRRVLSSTIGGICSSSRRFAIIGTQMRPPASLRMKSIASGVTIWAAMTRSPSFSRSSSSMTITILPARMSAMASSIGRSRLADRAEGRPAPAAPWSAGWSVRYEGSRRPGAQQGDRPIR